MPTSRDADTLYDLFSDPDVMHGLGKDPVSAPEEARAIIQEWTRPGLTQEVMVSQKLDGL